MKKKKMQKRGPAGDGRKIRIISVFWKKKKKTNLQLIFT